MTNPVHASVHINVTESQPKFHCMYDYLPAEGALRLSEGPLSIYISGTRSEIIDWARHVQAAAHEMPKAEEVQ